MALLMNRSTYTHHNQGRNNMAVNRRDFLKLSATVAGGSMLAGGGIAGMLMAGDRGGASATVHSVPTVCEMCFWKCGLIARVVNGRVVKLDGNPLHPQSRGKLCGRGQAGIGLLYDPDRLKRPFIRSGVRGDGRYRPASWNEALDITADKLKAISAKYGPESIALFSHGTSGDYFRSMVKGMGSPNITFPSFSQCVGARNVGYELTFGESPASSCERVDLTRSKVIVLIGTHLGENMHNTQVQDFAEAVANGARLIVVDPRFSTAAAKAHSWLPIRPGADTALLLSWINVIISEGLYDKEYVARYTEGFAELARAVREYTPAWAARETDLSESQIIETARQIGANSPHVCIHPGRHTSWYGNDTQRARAMAILTALLGSWGREGGIWLAPSAPLAKSPAPEFPEAARPEVITGGYPFAGGEGLTNAVRDATISGKPYPIKAWIMVGTNLLHTLPDPRQTMAAIGKLDLLLAIDVMPTDSVMQADIILPESSYLERADDLFVVKQKEAGIAIRQPAVAPLHESKPGWWIARELMLRLGLEKFAQPANFEQKLKAKAEKWGINFAALTKNGYIPVRTTSGPYISESNQPVFGTKSGKIVLASAELREHGFDAVPRYEKVPQPKTGQFRLLYGRSPLHTFSRTANNPQLNELVSENEVWINSAAASRLGIGHGAYVRLVNQDGVRSNRVRAKVTQRLRDECIYLVHGFGSTSPWLTKAHNKGVNDQQLITRYAVDPISGITGMRVNFVTIEREA